MLQAHMYYAFIHEIKLSRLLAFVTSGLCLFSTPNCQASTMTDRLVEIQYNDLAKLKQLYTPDDLKNFSVGYMTIENYTRWPEQNPEEGKYIKFYCLNGDFSDGTFIVTVCKRISF